jgi:hypothetical protein
MPRVELIYDMDCPNVRHAREALLKGFSEAGLMPSWTEWDRKSPGSPAYVRGYGSPTILVEGRDVGGVAPGNGESNCRLYRDDSGSFQGAPSVEQVAEALRAENRQPLRARLRDGEVPWRPCRGSRSRPSPSSPVRHAGLRMRVCSVRWGWASC